MSHGEINTVNVYAIDEERLKFRVIISLEGTSAAPASGAYDVNIPIPTSVTNSHEYSSCRIKCDNFIGDTLPADLTPSWHTGAGAPAGAQKLAAIELQLSTGSSQTTDSFVNAQPAAAIRTTQTEVSGFRQILPLQLYNVGNAAVATPAAGGMAWQSVTGHQDSILCSNPFGSQLQVRFISPILRDRVYLGTVVGGGAVSPDTGRYILQFQVDMVPNK